MHVHLIGVSGTGMGALAGLLRKAGHRVTGSDTSFHPPIGDALKAWGVERKPGWDPANLEPRPDLVVVGNVCRPDNPEARAAIDGGMRYASFPATLAELFLPGRKSFVIAGTHGKTTTSALVAFLLDAAGQEPGFLVGGVLRDFDESFALGESGSPFVVEGDEYDSAFFEKTPKFWQYRPWATILTSIEHDHVDIYPTMESYRAAFVELIARIPPDGLLVAWAGDPEVREVVKGARCRVRWYALDSDDCGDIVPIWSASPAGAMGGAQPFDLFAGGSSLGRVLSPLSGLHNVRNTVAAIALVAEGAEVAAQTLVHALPRFGGVRRRQELIGVAGGVRIYDDFAHHPTAVRETLGGLRSRHPEGRLIAVFEPRSATASRRTHQDEYPAAFERADLALLAPVGRPEIPSEQRLDVGAIAAGIQHAGVAAEAPGSIDAIVARVVAEAGPGDTVVIMSNGAFGGIHDAVLAGITLRRLETA